MFVHKSPLWIKWHGHRQTPTSTHRCTHTSVRSQHTYAHNGKIKRYRGHKIQTSNKTPLPPPSFYLRLTEAEGRREANLRSKTAAPRLSMVCQNGIYYKFSAVKLPKKGGSLHIFPIWLMASRHNIMWPKIVEAVYALFLVYVLVIVALLLNAFWSRHTRNLKIRGISRKILL